MSRLKSFLWLVVVTISLVLTPVAANADYKELVCDNNGQAQQDTSLFDADPGSDPGNKKGMCQYEGKPPIQHIFSYVICEFVQILNDVMDNMYCGMNYWMVKVISVLLSLYLTVYGAQILMGTAQVTTRDAILRVAKISFVFVFTTQSAYAIHFIFDFFLGIISTTSGAVIDTLSSTLKAKSDGPCEFQQIKNGNIMGLFSFLDFTVCDAFLGTNSQANSKVQGFFLSMAFAVPPLYLVFQWWILTTIKTMVGVVVGFLKSLAAIAFLVTLSPFFMGAFLFQSTAYLFENWLRYLISFSIQICLVLAIITLWILTITQFIGFFNELSEMVFPYVQPENIGAVYKNPSEYGICPPYFDVDSNTGAPTAECEEYGFDATPCDGSGNCDNSPNAAWVEDNRELLQPSQILNQGELLYYLFFHLSGLLLVSYSFALMLAEADKLSRNLAGPSSAPSLTPGWGGGIGSTNAFTAPHNIRSNITGEGAPVRMAAGFHDLVRSR